MEGRTIGGKYTLEREIARGGMGAIWLALDEQLRRKVALKLMSPDHLASPTARARFEREARAVAQLKSPNVVQIYDYGIDEGAPFIVMELLEGEDLQARLNRLGRLSLPAASNIVTQMAKAIGAAHAAGIIHRDIKPANVFLARTDTEEVVKVLDFGVVALMANLVASDSHVTRAGGVVGTPHFMSPEQVRASKTLDFRSDLWSIGVVAYRMLTGQLPFKSEAFGELLIEICSDPVPLASKLVPDLGPQLDRFFDLALARDPAKRFQSARDLAAAFASLASSTQTEKAAKILVVDDEPDVALLIKQRFRQQIRRGQFEFVFAADGAEALEQLRQHPDVEVALSDINMPGMDGLTFLRRASEVNPLLRVVMVSAYSDMPNIRAAMNRGAFDFLVKPIDFADLQITIDKTLKQARLARKSATSAEEAGLLKMFVSSGIVERLVPALRDADMGPGESIEATVAFINVHSFAPFADMQLPESALRALNANFEIILPEVITRGGVVDKFIGERVLAIFRGDNHAERAIDACLAVRSELKSLSARAGEGSAYGLGVSIGVHSGAMLSGSIGSKLVSRLDYTVLGNAVNIAARLQEIAGKNQIIISDTLAETALPIFECEPAGVRSLPGRTEKAMIHEVIRRLKTDQPNPSAETVLMDGEEPEPARVLSTPGG